MKDIIKPVRPSDTDRPTGQRLAWFVVFYLAGLSFFVILAYGIRALAI